MDQPDSRDGPNTDPLDEVLAEYLRRMDRGEDVDRERFLREYPEVADGLRAYFRDCEELIVGPTPSRPGAGGRPPAADGDPALPRRFGDYELLAELGRGGM